MRYATLITALLLGLPAFSQPSDTGIVLNIDVGYNTAYRNATWVPVDVLIENDQRDFEGWAEVRVFDQADVLQSPTYRVPADCPQNSKKWFRLYAWIDNASRIEAVLYEDGRLAVDTPAYVEAQPIGDDDLLGLVLDEDPRNYQFLYEPLRRFEGPRRISREDLDSETLYRLPDRLAAYEALDFIVAGDVDLSRIRPAHQRLLLEYVERGGTLVVFTGMHAQRVRDSWLAPHLGADIGRVRNEPEAVYRAAVFGGRAPRQYDEADACMVAALEPSAPDVRVFGEEEILAVRRDRGNGRIVTFAIDAASHALQDDARYAEVWHPILQSADRERAPASTEQMGAMFVNSLPQVSGVTIRPVSHVLTYLGLYIGVGIVLNWLFWSRLGRREYAWLTLLVVSFGFTAYAVMSGTSGIDGRRSQHRYTLLQVDENTALAREETMTGILSARMTRVEQPLDDPDALVREAGVASAAGRWGMPQAALQPPFHFVQQPEPAIANLRIGANEVRGYTTTTYRRLFGGVTGTVAEDGEELSVAVQNETGLEFESALLYLRGQFHPLEETGGVFSVAERPGGQSNSMQHLVDGRYGDYWRTGFYGSDWESLVSMLAAAPLIDERTSAPDTSVGPYFIGRVKRDPAPEAEAAPGAHGKASTVLLAELPYARGGHERYPLPRRFGDYSRYIVPSAAGRTAADAALYAAPIDLYLHIPEALRDRPGALELSIRPQESVQHGVRVMNARIGAEGPRYLRTTDGEQIFDLEDGGRYRIEDWKALMDPVSGEVHLRLESVRRSVDKSVGVYVDANMVTEPLETNEEWPGWR